MYPNFRKSGKLGKPLPKAGVFAHYQREVLAHNLAVKITGKGKTTRYNGFGSCFVEIGGVKLVLVEGISIRNLYRKSKSISHVDIGTGGKFYLR